MRATPTATRRAGRRPGPNDVLPCGTDSARRRHLAKAELCPVCEPADAPAGRRVACPGCGERVPAVDGAIAGHGVRIVRGGQRITTPTVCTGSGTPVRPLSPLSAALRERREHLGLTQAQVADRAQLPRSVVAGLETGVSQLQVPNLMAVADALGCELVAAPRGVAS
jgi:DNA-binding XRE family transcriptional regulator